MMKRVEMKEEMMEQVNGGSFTPNTFEEDVYNSFGIDTKYHTFSKDEFTLPNGTKTDMDGADAFIRKLIGEDEYNKLVEDNSYVNRLLNKIKNEPVYL